MMQNESKQSPPLEASLNEISTLIDTMDKGELTLEQSLAHFERGVILIKHCQKILTEAEQKVQILVQNQQQEPTLVPLNDNEQNES